jgi:hypothetical protein
MTKKRKEFTVFVRGSEGAKGGARHKSEVVWPGSMKQGGQGGGVLGRSGSGEVETGFPCSATEKGGRRRGERVGFVIERK